MFKRLDDAFKEKINKSLFIVSFVCYLLILFWVIIFKVNIRGAIYCGPGDLLYETIEVRYRAQFNNFTLADLSILEDIFLNILIFIPLPILLKLIFKKYKFWMNLIVCILFTFILELFQLFFGIGNFQYSDIVSNILGGALGYLIVFLFLKIFSNRTLNYINLVLIIIVVPIAIFAVINTIIHYEYYIPFFDGTSLKYLFK